MTTLYRHDFFIDFIQMSESWNLFIASIAKVKLLRVHAEVIDHAILAIFIVIRFSL